MNNPLDLMQAYFPIFFIVLWLLISTAMGYLSGWYALASVYPDRPEEPIVRLRGVSGRLGWIAMRGMLTLSACPSGLRVGLLRVLGPFCRPFFVPWDQVCYERHEGLFGSSVTMSFQSPGLSRLNLSAKFVDRLSAAVGSRWAKPAPVPMETASEVARRLFKRWLLISAVVVAWNALLIGSGLFKLDQMPAPFGYERNSTILLVLTGILGIGIVLCIQYFRTQKRAG